MSFIEYEIVLCYSSILIFNSSCGRQTFSGY